MSELSAGLRTLELQEREAYYRDRARRDPVDVVRDERPARRRVRWPRRAA